MPGTQSPIRPVVCVITVPREPLAADDGCNTTVVNTSSQVCKGPGEEGDPALIILDLETHSNKHEYSPDDNQQEIYNRKFTSRKIHIRKIHRKPMHLSYNSQANSIGS